ncbi:uncharacterized protein LOC144172543 isoform X3 [Haemaphysalis longicornis]
MQAATSAVARSKTGGPNPCLSCHSARPASAVTAPFRVLSGLWNSGGGPTLWGGERGGAAQSWPPGALVPWAATWWPAALCSSWAGTRCPSGATPSSTMWAGSATTPPLTPLLHLPSLTLRPSPLTVAFELAPSPSGTADTQSVARSPPAGYTGLLGSRAAARTATWSSSGFVGAGNMPVRVQDGAAPVLRPDPRGSVRQHPPWRSSDPEQPVRRPRAAFPTTPSSWSGDPEQLYHHSWPPRWFFANGSSWHRGPAAQPRARLAVTVNTEAVPVHAVLAS